jgi:hypothetical protein
MRFTAVAPLFQSFIRMAKRNSRTSVKPPVIKGEFAPVDSAVPHSLVGKRNAGLHFGILAQAVQAPTTAGRYRDRVRLN